MEKNVIAYFVIHKQQHNQENTFLKELKTQEQTEKNRQVE